MPNVIEFREGARIAISPQANDSTRGLVEMALVGAMALEGKAVRCAGVVPGVTMRVSTGGLRPRDSDEAAFFTADIWDKISPKLSEWLSMPAPPAGVKIQLGDVMFEFGWDARHAVSAGAMDIVVTHEPAAVAAYLRQRRRGPLAEPAPTAQALEDRQWAELPRRLVDAVLLTREASAARLARLPGLIRYRVTGAMAAWHALREAVDRVSSPTMTDSLKTVRIPLLMRQFEVMARDMLPHGAEGYSVDQVAMASSYSAVWMAFEVRGGVFYEPTPPLHRLLDAAYIADDVPIGMLNLPVDTLCIIPEPSRWGRAGQVEAIAIFRNAHSIGFVAWIGQADDREGLHMDALELATNAPDKTISELLDNEFRGSNPYVEKARELWRSALDYSIKMLLYLNARDAHVVHDRVHSNAPRNFGGLGKRRRAQRLAEIEMLYDRHVVGPAILDAEPAAWQPTDGTSREVRGHWRRPHFKMQPYGPNASLRKLVFIGPTIVRPDRLQQG